MPVAAEPVGAGLRKPAQQVMNHDQLSLVKRGPEAQLHQNTIRLARYAPKRMQVLDVTREQRAMLMSAWKECQVGCAGCL